MAAWCHTVTVCNICGRMTWGGDHLDCIQMKRIEAEDEERKERLPEDLDIAKDPQDLDIQIKALLEHITRS